MSKEHNIEDRVKICFDFFGLDVEVNARDDSYMNGKVLYNVDHCCPYGDKDCSAQYVDGAGKILCKRIFDEENED